MGNLTYKIQQQRQKMHIKAYALLCLIIAVLMGYYSYQKWQQYSITKAALSANEQIVEILRGDATSERLLYDSSKKDFNALSKEIGEKVKFIFPETDQYTALTRQLDIMEEDLSKKNNPFEVSNIEYQSSTSFDGYSVLPVRMNIRSSADNFRKFLHIVETSGSLDDEIRLLDISSIRLTFESSEKSTKQIINFTVQLNAYYQQQS